MNGGEDYVLEIRGAENTSARFAFPASEVCSGGTCAASPPMPLAAGAYAWRVQARNASGRGSWSEEKAFTVEFLASVGAGHAYFLATTPAGEILAWGSNAHGAFGDSTMNDRPAPGLVGTLAPFTAVGGGESHSVALHRDGGVWTWGYNGVGQLGQGDFVNRVLPVRVAGLARVRAISVGANHVLALLSDGSLRAWGSNAHGQIGDGTNSDRWSPVAIFGLTDLVAIGAGENHSLAVTRDGRVYAWGDNFHGQLGDGTTTERWSPVRVRGIRGAVAVASGPTAHHSLALLSDGSVVAWGANSSAQLGDGGAQDRLAPVRVRALKDVVHLAAGERHSLAVRSDGSLWGWGDGSQGQLGEAVAGVAFGPVRVPGFSDVVRVASGRVASVVLKADGSFETLGGEEARAGEALEEASPAESIQEPAAPASPVVSPLGEVAPDRSDIQPFSTVSSSNPPGVAGGERHSLVLKDDGTVWSFGDNSAGQLGDGTLTQRLTPVQVSGLSGVSAVAGGAYHSVALKTDGTVYAWGQNGFGQLGDATTTNRSQPVQVLTQAGGPALTGVTAITAGAYHTLALKNDGTLWSWGYNASGQLGDNTIVNRSSPVQVTGLSGVIALAGGRDHSVAVKSGGTVWAWGLNTYGQLGDGTTTNRTAPVQVDGLSGILDVAAGSQHSLALRDDNTVWSWGAGGQGQIGNGSTLNRLTPVRSTGVSGITAIAAGGYHSLAIKSDGTLWVWGRNDNGQVGDGTTTNRATPVQLTTPTGVVKIGAGDLHSLAIASGNVVWAWGGNTSAQLGDGTTVNRLSPIQVSDSSFNWKVGTPTFSVAAGTYNTDQTVVVSCVTAGATIHYTTSGADPTEADPVVASGGTVTVDKSLTLKAKAWKAGLAPSNTASAAYTLKVLTPTFSPAGGNYTTAQNVTMTVGTSGAVIRYTADGSEPTASSTLYTGPVLVGTTTTLKAKGFKTDWADSDTQTATYTMSFGQAAAPTMSPAPGTYVTSVSVTLSGPAGATIRYTTNGTDPTASSTAYTSPINLTVTTTLKAKSFHPDYTPSTTTTGVYTIKVVAPAVSPGAGTYDAGTAVTLTSSDSAATIRYTYP